MGSGTGSDQAQGCNTSLSLDLTGFNNINSNTTKKLEKPSSSISALRFDHVFPGLSLGLVADQGLSMSPGSSSYSNYSSSMKRSLDHDRDFGGFHGDEVDKGSSRTSEEEEEEDEASPRKKLRLTKEQSAVLEDSFKEHSTLNPQQKQALAKRLNLRPRQVEVWFQNRRARTKLKQTEMDCEVLKKCCETLSEENKRLQKELHDLKSLKSSTPSLYMQMPSPTLSMCPSCERFISTATSPVAGHHLTAAPQVSAKPPQSFFTHHSAAC